MASPFPEIRCTRCGDGHDVRDCPHAALPGYGTADSKGSSRAPPGGTGYGWTGESWQSQHRNWGSGHRSGSRGQGNYGGKGGGGGGGKGGRQSYDSGVRGDRGKGGGGYGGQWSSGWYGAGTFAAQWWSGDGAAVDPVTPWLGDPERLELSLKAFYVLMGMIAGFLVFHPKGRDALIGILTLPIVALMEFLGCCCIDRLAITVKRRVLKFLRRMVRASCRRTLLWLGGREWPQLEGTPYPSQRTVVTRDIGVQVGHPGGRRDVGFPPGVAEQIASTVNAPPPHLARVHFTMHGECWHANEFCMALRDGDHRRPGFHRRPCRICSLGYWDVDGDPQHRVD